RWSRWPDLNRRPADYESRQTAWDASESWNQARCAGQEASGSVRERMSAVGLDTAGHRSRWRSASPSNTSKGQAALASHAVMLHRDRLRAFAARKLVKCLRYQACE